VRPICTDWGGDVRPICTGWGVCASDSYRGDNPRPTPGARRAPPAALGLAPLATLGVRPPRGIISSVDVLIRILQSFDSLMY